MQAAPGKGGLLTQQGPKRKANESPSGSKAPGEYTKGSFKQMNGTGMVEKMGELLQGEIVVFIIPEFSERAAAL